MKYKIVSDSTSNVTRLGSVDYAYVPLHIIVDKDDFRDDDNIDVEEMMKALDSYKGSASTACPSTADWIEAFSGADVVFGITITSGLSGTYSTAVIARDIYLEKNPDKKIYLYDSLSTGPEMALIIDKLEELISQGKNDEEIDAQIREYMGHTHLYFSLASLNNLAKSGRVNSILAKGIGVLHIRVLGKASEEGQLKPMDKKRGDNKAVPTLIEMMKAENYKGGKVIISHTSNPDGSELLKNLITHQFGFFNGRIMENRGLVSYYAEPSSILVAFES